MALYPRPDDALMRMSSPSRTGEPPIGELLSTAEMELSALDDVVGQLHDRLCHLVVGTANIPSSGGQATQSAATSSGSVIGCRVEHLIQSVRLQTARLQALEQAVQI